MGVRREPSPASTSPPSSPPLTITTTRPGERPPRRAARRRRSPDQPPAVATSPRLCCGARRSWRRRSLSSRLLDIGGAKSSELCLNGRLSRGLRLRLGRGPPQTSSRNAASSSSSRSGLIRHSRIELASIRRAFGQLLGEHPRVRERVQRVGVVADHQRRLLHPHPLVVMRRRGARGTGPRAPRPRAPGPGGASRARCRRMKLVRGIRLATAATRLQQRLAEAQPEQDRGEDRADREQRVVQHRHLDHHPLAPAPARPWRRSGWCWRPARCRRSRPGRSRGGRAAPTTCCAKNAIE